MSDAGLSTTEGLEGRVQSWRRRHRARAEDVAVYRVIFDGDTVAELEPTRTRDGLDAELAAAAWELAQGLARAVTLDVLALDREGVELARMPLRVLPQRPAGDSPADMAAVVRALLEQQGQMARLVTDLVGSVATQLREVSAITTELARASSQRARSAEQQAAAATEAAHDALALAREGGEGARSVQDRGLDLIEAFVRAKVEAASSPSSGSEP